MADKPNNEVFTGPTLISVVSAGFTHGDLFPCVLSERCLSLEGISFISELPRVV